MKPALFNVAGSLASVADLIRSFKGVIDLATSNCNRIADMQFIRRQRGDRSFLINSKLVRQRTGLDTKGNTFARFIDGICAVVANHTSDYGFGFFRRRGRWVTGRDFWNVGIREHHKKTTARVEDIVTLRIAAIPLQLAAILVRLLPRGKRPDSNELLFERLFLGKGIA